MRNVRPRINNNVVNWLACGSLVIYLNTAESIPPHTRWAITCAYDRICMQVLCGHSRFSTTKISIHVFRYLNRRMSRPLRIHAICNAVMNSIFSPSVRCTPERHIRIRKIFCAVSHHLNLLHIEHKSINFLLKRDLRGDNRPNRA